MGREGRRTGAAPVIRTAGFQVSEFQQLRMTSVSWYLCLLLCLLLPVSPLRTVKLGGKDCNYEGKKICNGAVTKEIGSTLVKVCSDGRVKTKARKTVGEGFPLYGTDTGPGKDCTWDGTVFCDGDVIEDLHRWWFLMKCSKSKFSVYSRSYTEVTNDKRFSP